jgi:primosomal protein N' (replication factor Y)
VTTVVRVVPDVPTFAVDDGFLYVVGDGTPVRVGSVVRVPLSGRTVRGTVVDVGSGDPAGLKAVSSVSPALPLLDEPHLALHRWLAHHYVGPLAASLRSAAPPNLPRSAAAIPEPVRGRGGRVHLVTDDGPGAAEAALDDLDDGRSALVVCPTVGEAETVAERLAGRHSVVLATGDTTGAEETRAWVTARTRAGTVVVGTPRVAAWPVAALDTAVCVDDARRGHKSRQSPTVHTRTLLSQRTRFEGIRLVTSGLVPAPESVAAGARVVPPATGRSWGRIEVVDRTEDPPGTGVVGRAASVAIAAAAKAGDRVVVFSHRRGYAPAFRCTGCRTLRTCPECGSRATLTTACARCASPLGRCPECGGATFEPLGAAAGVLADRLAGLVDRRLVGLGPGHPVSVVTERDLPGLGSVDLAVAVDADALVLGPSYRSAEDALRVLARLAARVGHRSGNRLMVQTAVPSHPVFDALRHGSPETWLAEELARRETLGYPPSGELIVVETRGGDADPFAEASWPGVAVLGPLDRGDGRRWLVQGPDLNRFRRDLRPIVRRIRDGGGEVRVDVDPIDL